MRPLLVPDQVTSGVPRRPHDAPGGSCGAPVPVCGVGIGLAPCAGRDHIELDVDKVTSIPAVLPTDDAMAKDVDAEIFDIHEGRSEGLPSVYSTSGPQPMLGKVLRSGEAWLAISAKDSRPGSCDRVERGELRLFANGLRFVTNDKPWCPADPVLELLLVPFSFVKVVSVHLPALEAAMSGSQQARILNIAIYLEACSFLFGFVGESDKEAEHLCAAWVADISRSIRWVTESLFARGSCCLTSPSWDEDASNVRLMAGRLLQSEAHGGPVHVRFVELFPPKDGKARMVLYSDVGGRRTGTSGAGQEQELLIDQRTNSFEKVGVGCSCLALGPLHLCARTVFERQLWLRALANLKVKLQHGGKGLRPDDVCHWREAINEHILANLSKLRNQWHSVDRRPGVGVASLKTVVDAGGCASVPVPAEYHETAAILTTAMELAGLPLLQRCAPLTRAAGDDDDDPHEGVVAT